MTVLAASRRDADLSQDQLAEKLGAPWSRDMVAAVERGRRKVLVSDLLAYAAALGLDPQTLLLRIARW